MKNNRIWWERRKLKITIASTLDEWECVDPIVKDGGMFCKALKCV